ncbi:hypothetical protein BLA29_002565 [Euroglyphus maynei]|uniref:Uncharacterized protein n=1 Tax=Euroglyphus maynei TaxID=6958 RepID=A0A1Y3APP6_EURMA|nr:hypothetical protein BLA29_002565 [Euroglyphus maynei]
MSDSSLQLLIKTYCLFTFVCFEKPSSSSIQCPDFCQCFQAPLDDGVTKQTLSLVCMKSESLLDEKFPHYDYYPILNSLIINVKDSTDGTNDLQWPLFSTTNQIITVRHLTLQGFTGRLSDIEKPSIFGLFDTDEIKSLSFIEWNNDEIILNPLIFNFFILKKFSQLQVLRFESCFWQVMDENFNNVPLNELHTLIIRQSSLKYIHRQAFHRKAGQFRRIIITKNQLTNLKWITSVPETFESLWHLDLSYNLLRILPLELIEKLPNLKVLNIQQNNFKFFQFNTLQPWFKIQEFRLSDKPGNTLYVNDQMQWISDLPSISKQIHSMFTLNSFLNHYQYCIEKGVFKMNDLWNQLEKLKYRSYIPDRLIISNGDDHGQLVINNCDDNPIQMNDPIYLVGLEISKLLIHQEDTFFKTLSSLEDSMPPIQPARNIKNAIKLSLMDTDMWNLWQNGNSKRTSEQILLWIDIVVELLNIAYTKNYYIMLTLWPYEYYKNLALPSDLSNAENFKQTIIKPLIDEIHDHPALIGIEIVDNAFRTQLSNSKENIDENIADNNCPYNDEFLRQIHDEIQFIAYHVLMLEEFTKEPMIGIGMDSNCRPCLPLLLINECLFDQSTNGGSNIDFITIRSPFSSSNTIYGYHELENNFNNWFLQHKKMNSIDKKRFFYSIYSDDDNDKSVSLQDDVVKILQKFTMGYFTPSYHQPSLFHVHSTKKK